MSSFTGGKLAIEEFAKRPDEIDMVITDLKMEPVDGMQVLEAAREQRPPVEVIVFTGLAQVDTAVTCMKLGAFDYLAKPFTPEELKLAVSRALERRDLRRENLTLKLEVGSRYRLDNMIGASAKMQQV